MHLDLRTNDCQNIFEDHKFIDGRFIIFSDYDHLPKSFRTAISLTSSGGSCRHALHSEDLNVNVVSVRKRARNLVNRLLVYLKEEKRLVY